MSCGNSNCTVRNISNARFLFYFFSGPDAIEKHIVTKVKLLFIGDILCRNLSNRFDSTLHQKGRSFLSQHI